MEDSTALTVELPLLAPKFFSNLPPGDACGDLKVPDLKSSGRPAGRLMTCYEAEKAAKLLGPLTSSLLFVIMLRPNYS